MDNERMRVKQMDDFFPFLQDNAKEPNVSLEIATDFIVSVSQKR
jgi:hypothetical protein